MMMRNDTPQYEMSQKIAQDIMIYAELYQPHPDRVARIYGAMKDVESLLNDEMSAIRDEERRRV